MLDAHEVQDRGGNRAVGKRVFESASEQDRASLPGAELRPALYSVLPAREDSLFYRFERTNCFVLGTKKMITDDDGPSGFVRTLVCT